MAIRRFSTAEPGVKSNRFWDQDTAQGAMVPIATQIFVGTTSDINFTNIPQTFQDLMIVVNGRSSFAANDVLIQSYLNGDFSATTYSNTRLEGDGASANSTRNANTGAVAVGHIPASSASVGVTGSIVYHIFNYTSSTTFKTTLSRWAADRNGAGRTGLFVTLWRNTNALTSVGVATYGLGNLTGSVTLYGIKAGA